MSSICQVTFGSSLFTRLYDVLLRTSNPRVIYGRPTKNIFRKNKIYFKLKGVCVPTKKLQPNYNQKIRYLVLDEIFTIH